MRKTERFFVNLFVVTFVICAMVIGRDYFLKQMEIAKIKKYEQSVELQETMGEEMQGISDVHEEEKENIVGEISSEDFAEQSSEEETIFEVAGYEYFADALFIGDSRTVGLMEYGNIENAMFFADSGMSVFALEKKKVSIPNEGKVSFDELLNDRQYGKIYLMLGINELGYRFENIQKKYKETVEKIKECQENAIIYLCANMHVTEEQSQKDEIYNNANVNKVNEMIRGLADNETTFYIDVNGLFDDENGNLSTEYSSDSFHVYGKYYIEWANWLCTMAVKICNEC